MPFTCAESEPSPRNGRVAVDAAQILAAAGLIKSTLTFKPKQNICTQGSPAQAIYFIKSGKVRLTVVSEQGREGVVAILGPQFFFGENCLAYPHINTSSATAMVKTVLVRIERGTMLRVLREDPALASMFLSFLVERNRQTESDLLDHLFNSSEQRLARVLIQLSEQDSDEDGRGFIPKISQDVLAARVGTTRSRINFFMNKFRRLGYINYAAGAGNGRPGLRVSATLMSDFIKE